MSKFRILLVMEHLVKKNEGIAVEIKDQNVRFDTSSGMFQQGARSEARSPPDLCVTSFAPVLQIK
jgi:hypothetical protein